MIQLDQELPTHPLGKYRPKQGGRPHLFGGNPSCRGGHTTAGYVLEYSPDHPNSDKSGFVLQHRLVAECYLGRLLRRDEVVHHRNGDRADNRWQNLLVMTRDKHRNFHGNHDAIPLSDDIVRKALDGRCTSEAAKLLRVHPQTLRNRFDHLLSKRRSPGQSFPRHFVEHVRELALDSRVSLRDAMQILHTSGMSIRRCCRMENIEWQAAPSGSASRRMRKADDVVRSLALPPHETAPGQPASVLTCEPSGRTRGHLGSAPDRPRQFSLSDATIRLP